MAKQKEYIIDGNAFKTYNEFTKYFSKIVLKNHQWNGNLNAFNDILYGGFGTPENGFKIRWINANVSRLNLGRQETINWYEEALKNSHQDYKKELRNKINLLNTKKNKTGESTLFDFIVNILQHIDNDEDYSVTLKLEY